ncbi:MAG: hypothetical protein ABR541_00450 [Candidatus Dormibacteria bacterium]
MRDLLASLIGVPAAILVAAGLGIIGVTVISRLRSLRGGRPIRWAHLALGVALGGIGVLLLRAGLAVSSGG